MDLADIQKKTSIANDCTFLNLRAPYSRILLLALGTSQAGRGMAIGCSPDDLHLQGPGYEGLSLLRLIGVCETVLTVEGNGELYNTVHFYKR
jgi:hypothetical protein